MGRRLAGREEGRRSRASYGAGWLPHRRKRSVDVSDGICFAGLDVHARKTAAAAVQLGSGEVFKAQLAGSPGAAIEWLRTLPGPVRAVYEAGPTGFGLARAARAAGIEVMVCSPGAIPRQPGDRIKTDTRDALKLARLHAAGQLRAVVVPGARAGGAARPRARARGPARRSDERAGIGSASCCCAAAWSGAARARPGRTRHLRWLSAVRFDQPLVEVVFGEYLGPPRGAARAPRSPGRADRRAGRARAVGADWSRGCVACAASTR